MGVGVGLAVGLAVVEVAVGVGVGVVVGLGLAVAVAVELGGAGVDSWTAMTALACGLMGGAGGWLFCGAADLAVSFIGVDSAAGSKTSSAGGEVRVPAWAGEAGDESSRRKLPSSRTAIMPKAAKMTLAVPLRRLLREPLCLPLLILKTLPVW